MPRSLSVDPAQLGEFCRRWRITELSLFGSILREDFGPDSDVDVLVSFEPHASWSLFDLVAMQQELTTMLGRPVDLIEEAGLRNPFRRATILKSKQTLYAA